MQQGYSNNCLFMLQRIVIFCTVFLACKKHHQKLKGRYPQIILFKPLKLVLKRYLKFEQIFLWTQIVKNFVYLARLIHLIPERGSSKMKNASILDKEVILLLRQQLHFSTFISHLLVYHIQFVWFVSLHHY